jgi:DNA-binding beta-propeller fold protein YncE
MYCYAEGNECRKSAFLNLCPVRDGSAANTAVTECQCGESTCTAGTGYICFSISGGGSCRQNTVGTYGYTKIANGYDKCDSVNGRHYIFDQTECKKAAEGLGLEDDGKGTKEQSAGNYPPGCNYGTHQSRNGNLKYNTLSTSTAECISNSHYCLCGTISKCIHTDGKTTNNGACLCNGKGTFSTAKNLYCYALTNGASTACSTTPIASEKMLSSQINMKDDINLQYINAMAVSADSKHVYAVATGSKSVIFWSRDAYTGVLTNQVEYKDDTFFENVQSLTLSPDGKNMYIVAKKSIVHFDRDKNTGILTNQVNSYFDPNIQITDVKVSFDGKHVYVTTGVPSSIVYFDRDADSGHLTKKVELLQPGVLQSMVVSSNGKHAYAVATTGNSVYKFDRNPETGNLTGPIKCNSNNLLEPTSITISTDGKTVYAVFYVSHSIVHWDRNIDTGEISLQDNININSPQSITVSQDGNSVYVVTAGTSNSIVQFDRDITSGVLTNQISLKDDIHIKSPTNVIVSPDGNSVYVTASNANSVILWKRNVLPACPKKDTILSSSCRCTNSPTLWHSSLATRSQYCDEKISAYKPVVDCVHTDGLIANEVACLCGGGGAAAVATATACTRSAGLYCYALKNGASIGCASTSIIGEGMLSSQVNQADQTTNLDGVNSVVVSSDGRNVYAGAMGYDDVTKTGSNSIVSWDRNKETGAITNQRILIDDEILHSHGSVMDLACSSDRKDVYIVSHGRIAHLDRDLETGDLTKRNIYTDYINLRKPRSVQVSSDGKNVYVVSETSKSIVHWQRNVETGALANKIAFIDETNLNYASSVVVSPNGKNVYVVGSGRRLVSWDRDQHSGALSNQINIHDEKYLQGAYSISISPDGKNLYVVMLDNFVIHFVC